jgi:hypothetical protein
MSKTVYHFHNRAHLGDCLMPLRFLYSLRDILKEKNICVNFYYNQDYINNTYMKELQRYSIPDTIVLLPLFMTPPNALQLWIYYPVDGITHSSWSLYYDRKQAQMLEYMNLDKTQIDTSFWINEPYLLDLYKTLPTPYQDIDILVVNSAAFSGQYQKGPEEMNELCRFLNKSYSIVTTRKVDSIKCTLDADFRIQDIAAMATHCKYVIAIMTAPITGLYNKQTQASVKKWFTVVSDGTYHTHKGIDHTAITDGNLQPVYDYFSSLSALV